MRTKYLILTENNDHEGESWHFYLNYTPELESFMRDNTDGDAYSLTVATLDPETIMSLPDTGGYMPAHNIVGDIDLDRLGRANWQEDPLYKGGIGNFVYKQVAARIITLSDYPAA